MTGVQTCALPISSSQSTATKDNAKHRTFRYFPVRPLCFMLCCKIACVSAGGRGVLPALWPGGLCGVLALSERWLCVLAILIGTCAVGRPTCAIFSFTAQGGVLPAVSCVGLCDTFRKCFHNVPDKTRFYGFCVLLGIVFTFLPSCQNDT